jgi:hypothetical protein
MYLKYKFFAHCIDIIRSSKSFYLLSLSLSLNINLGEEY